MRILVVEDDPLLADAVAKHLRREGYVVDVVSDGPTASEQAFVEDYDLIVLDIMLPGRDGLSVLRELREERVETPVLLLTARSQVEDRVAGLDAGADDYLVKPFALAELLARVRALLRRATGEHSAELTAGDLVLNPATREVRRAGQSIHLTPKEFALLEFLLRNKGRVLTRLTLAEHVWGDNFDVMTNFIDVHIKNLRRKIDTPFQGRLIHTVRGVGYTLRDPELAEDD